MRKIFECSISAVKFQIGSTYQRQASRCYVEGRLDFDYQICKKAVKKLNVLSI